MTKPEKATKESLLKAIKSLESNPNDKVRLLGDAGISVVGAGLGAAAAGTVASATGATSIFGITAAAKLIGLSVVSATPIGWAVGASALGAGAVYGISRLIRNGAISEGKRKELLQKFREEMRDIEVKERAGNISDSDKTSFHISLKELIQRDAISPEKAQQLIGFVENGRIPISQAMKIVADILQGDQTNTLDEIKNRVDEESGSVGQQLQKNNELLKALIGEVEVAKETVQHHNELLLNHDELIVNHGLAFGKVQDYVTSLEQQIQRTAARMEQLQRLLYIALGASFVSIVICVAILLK